MGGKREWTCNKYRLLGINPGLILSVPPWLFGIGFLAGMSRMGDPGLLQRVTGREGWEKSGVGALQTQELLERSGALTMQH